MGIQQADSEGVLFPFIHEYDLESIKFKETKSIGTYIP